MRNRNQEEEMNPYISIILVVGYILIIILKITGILQWAWWIVLAPIWLPILFVVGAIALSFTTEWIKSRNKKKGEES